MAGSYPDAPAPRMAWDRDGTVLLQVDVTGGSSSQKSATDRQVLNNEASDEVRVDRMGGGDGQVGALCVIFPELRDVSAFLFATDSPTGWSWLQAQVSINTTNGADGTWTDVGTARTAGFSKSTMRSPRTPSSAITGAKAIRFPWTGTGSLWGYVNSLHVYGRPSTGEAPDRLLFYEPSTAAEVGPAFFDWGDVPRSSTFTRSFRIHNPSASLTATAVTVTMEALTDASPTNVGQHEFSTDGGSSWQSSASLGNLGPGATSGVVMMRRTTPASAALSLWWTRMVASASSWT